jgi:hypothetical protein
MEQRVPESAKGAATTPWHWDRRADVLITIAGLVVICICTMPLYVLSGLTMTGLHHEFPTWVLPITFVVTPLFILGLTFAASLIRLAINRRAWWIPPVGLVSTIVLLLVAGLALRTIVAAR